VKNKGTHLAFHCQGIQGEGSKRKIPDETGTPINIRLPIEFKKYEIF